MDHASNIDLAFDEAFNAVRSNSGGPFGAVIVKNGGLIGKGANCVSSTNDPTAHAEIMAIRHACQTEGDFQLSGATLYATCEPCPMCLAAIYWAKIKTVYYVSTRHDAEKIGFMDSDIHDELGIDLHLKSLKMIQTSSPRAEILFQEWKDKVDKTPY